MFALLFQLLLCLQVESLLQEVQNEVLVLQELRLLHQNQQMVLLPLVPLEYYKTLVVLLVL
jgi:hypothetical protein